MVLDLDEVDFRPSWLGSLHRQWKDQLAEVARLMTLHLAHYAWRHGDIPHQNLLELLGVVELTEQQTKLLRDGMEFLTDTWTWSGTCTKMMARRLSNSAAIGPLLRQRIRVAEVAFSTAKSHLWNLC